MNRTCARLALAATYACTISPALAQVSIYGVIDAHLDYSANGRTSATRVQSGGVSGSRLGLRGSEAVSGATRAIFVLESGMNLDDGTSGQGGLLFGRQAFVGLSGPAGELTVGRHYSPQFFALVTHGLGGGMAWGNASNYFTDTSILRVSNSVSYLSPSLNGLRVRALYGAGEQLASPGDIASTSLQYEQGPLTATVSLTRRKTSTINSDRYAILGASYDWGWARTALMLQTRRDDIGAAENDAYEAALMVPLATGSLLLDTGRFYHRNVEDADATAVSLRYEHALSKRTMLYAGAAQICNQPNARFAVNGNTSAALAAHPGARARSIITGVRHTF